LATGATVAGAVGAFSSRLRKKLPLRLNTMASIVWRMAELSAAAGALGWIP
jgi:hypothetical protein